MKFEMCMKIECKNCKRINECFKKKKAGGDMLDGKRNRRNKKRIFSRKNI